MQVIWHHHPSTEIVEAPFTRPYQNRVGNERGDAVVLEPEWTRCEPIRDTVNSREGVAGSPVAL